jgi:hypothetical protein
VKRNFSILLAVLFSVLLFSNAQAGERTRSGKYQGKHSSGTFDTKVSREPGRLTKDTAWQNEKGQGARHMERNWDKEKGTGSYSSTTTNPDGKTTSRAGTVTRNEDGSLTQKVTVTGAQGKVTDLQRDMKKNEDGSRSVHSVYTKPNDETVTVDKTIKKTDTGRDVTGNYSSSTGKSGTFQSSSNVSEGKRTTSQSLTNQDGKTWKRNIDTAKEGDTINRTVTTTNPEGETKTFTQSVTLE